MYWAYRVVFGRYSRKPVAVAAAGSIISTDVCVLTCDYFAVCLLFDLLSAWGGPVVQCVFA